MQNQKRKRIQHGISRRGNGSLTTYQMSERRDMKQKLEMWYNATNNDKKKRGFEERNGYE